MSEDVDRLAQERLSAEERRLSRRTTVTLEATGRAFWRYPSPWMLTANLLALVVARVARGGWSLADAWAPLIFLALFPVLEWGIHVFILHWRPRKLAGITVDSLLAREHRAHHADPRDVPLVFIPWRALIWVIAVYDGLGLLLFPHVGQALTFLVTVAVVGLVYEWIHYLIHSDYKPRSRLYKAVWRNHRLHHYKNEHYWFSVTTSGTSDRLFGTHPDPETVAASKTARNLHGAMD
ncbi:MAG: putative rane protein [Marmoricola sp.]|jgi:hypothetical protein|nr:putative rane protein [Marmoricola sp.]